MTLTPQPLFVSSVRRNARTVHLGQNHINLSVTRRARTGDSSVKAPVVSDDLLLLGIAENESSLYLDLHEPSVGPLLVAGGRGSGKTALLQSLARASNVSDPGDVQFGVVTPFPEEWTPLEALPNCLGVWPALHSSAQAFLEQLIHWAKVWPRTRQAALVFCDGFDQMIGEASQFQADLRWLLVHGPRNRMWPVASVNPQRLSHPRPWVDLFHTRILGRMEGKGANWLGSDVSTVDLAGLCAGEQFVLSGPDRQQVFRLPSPEGQFA